MQEKIDWAKLHYLGKELLELENNVAKEVFVNEKFDPKKYRKLDTMRSLSVSMGKNSKIKASLNLKEKVDALSAIEQEELIRLLIVQSGLEENEFFNPVVLSFIEDNLFSINDEYCKILGKGIYKDYLSEYAEKLIAKNNLKIITKSPEKIINSENFIFSNILNAVSSLKINWGVNGLLKDRYNFNNRDKYLNGKKVMNNLIDFILENSNFKAIYDKTLWINKYKEFFDNASVEELNIFAERIEKVLTTPIKEKYIYFLKNLLNAVDYYEVGLKDNHKKVTYMLSKDIFNNLFIDSEDCIIVDIDKLFKMQFLTAYASVNQNNMSNHVLEGRNNLISESFIPLNVLTESSVALYGLDCFENTELSNSFIQEHFKKYNMKVIMDTFNIEKEDREVESLVNEFIKDIKVDIDICNLLKLKINLLNNVIQILGSQSVVFELKEDNGKFAVFNKDKNSHINLYEIFQHLLFNRFSEKEDYFENLEVNIQHNLMKTENLLLKSKVKGKLLKF